MSNATACAITSNCTILDGATTNGTFYVSGYDPFAPVPHWHQRLELATICITNSLTLIVILARLSYRWLRFRRFRGDDRWMAFTVIILIGYYASQIGTVINGSGLHMPNVHYAWLKLHWQFSTGWAGYYIISSCIKISVCFTFLELLPHHRMALRYSVIGLCVFQGSLGITLAFAWIFQCTPFLSNFIWSVNSTSCINYDILRWLWIGLSIPIDMVLLAVPLRILQRSQVRENERRILRIVFSANLLGTIACILGIYGVYESRVVEHNDAYYHEAPFIMMNDIEILMYALGASFPVLSRYLVSKTDTSRQVGSNFSSWARHIPDFFLPDSSAMRTSRGHGATATDRHDLEAQPTSALRDQRRTTDKNDYHMTTMPKKSESSHTIPED